MKTTIVATITDNPLITVDPKTDPREHRVIEFRAETDNGESIHAAGALAHDQHVVIHAGDTVVLIGEQHGTRFDFTALFTHALGTLAATPLPSWLDTHQPAEPEPDRDAADLARRQQAAAVFRTADLGLAAERHALTIDADDPTADISIFRDRPDRAEVSFDLLGRFLDIKFKVPFPTS